ncbi:hypothetical protein BDQ12DRAFT_668805 [Crucibulum laeve]|uniref:Uncharacterized protein n=1 Tax=Crucibulum laeve TaxID=68775 RepID=A0A5C3LRA1_9AGAR|nr:hypothetical protein BDQ12DRAFT_668805 [Crucibulum laeve]
MVEYTLNVQIDPEDLQILKDYKYNLCTARKTCEMNKAGVVSDVIGSTDNSGKFKIINKFGKVSFGVNTKVGDQVLLIFVTPTTVLDTALFEPITAVQVCFSLEQQTATTILSADSEVVQVKYQGKVIDRTIAYKKWKVAFAAPNSCWVGYKLQGQSSRLETLM